jgi:transposase
MRNADTGSVLKAHEPVLQISARSSSILVPRRSDSISSRFYREAELVFVRSIRTRLPRETFIQEERRRIMTLPKLGIDMAKRTFVVALFSQENPEKHRHKTLENTPTGFQALTAWLTHQGVSHVHAVMEATSTYGEDLALYLYQAGHRVSVVNPARIKAFGASELQRTKNDRADATLIARFAIKHEPEAWTPPPEELRQLQALVRHRVDLIAQRSQWQQRLTDSRPVPAVRTSLQTLLTALEAQLQQLEEQIRIHVAQHPTLRRQQDLLASIPGIGEMTAARLLAEMAPLQTFRSARHAAAYAGLTPRQHQSGSSVRGRTHLSKIGSARIRKALYWPAIAALRCNPLICQFGERLRERGKAKMVVIGAAMRKLVHLAYGVLKTGMPFDEQHALGAVRAPAREGATRGIPHR